MKVKDVMTSQVIRIRPEEPVSVAARMLEHYNIGALPVCGGDGALRGMVTDRDLVVRCLASERAPRNTTVGDVMTGRVVCVQPETELALAARLMGANQVRRLPVTRDGVLCGMVSLADLAAQEETAPEAEDALRQISGSHVQW